MQLLDRVDRAEVAYGSVIFLAHLSNALAEIRPWLDDDGEPDRVRSELVRALQRGIPVVPVQVDGLEHAPRAFIGLLRGENFGKLQIRVG